MVEEDRAILRRSRLHERLDETLQRRLTVVVAGAGFGKTTLVREWADAQNTAWHTVGANDSSVATFAKSLVNALRLRVPDLPPDLLLTLEGTQGPDADADEAARADAYAAAVCDALRDRQARDLVLVFDDVEEIDERGASARLISGICRQAPDRLHVVLVSRHPPPFRIERMRGRGEVADLTPSDLAFTREETVELLGGDAELAELIFEVAHGWPAGTRLAYEALRHLDATQRAAAAARLRRPDGPLFPYLAEEVFEQEEPALVELLARLAPLDHFNVAIATAVGGDDSAELLQMAEARGVYLEPDISGDGWRSLTPLVRTYVLDRYTRQDTGEVLLVAAEHLEGAGRWGEALRSLTAAGHSDGVVDLLERQGTAMVAAADVDPVVDAIEVLPPAALTPLIQQLLGQARQIQGDWDGALEAFRELVPEEGEIDAGVAWRLGLIHHLRGELDLALAAYERGSIDTGDHRDRALLCGWKASVHWLRGEIDVCKELAALAMRSARAGDDKQALAITHTVLAMIAAVECDRRANEAHYLRALEYAERAQDVMQIIRIHVNRSSLHHEEAYYAEALAELDVALELANLAGFATFRALGLVNRGEAHLGLGRLEEARADFEEAKTVYGRLTSRDMGYALLGLGNVYKLRGDLALARGAFEEVVSLTEGTEDLQARVPALAGLAEVLIDDDPGTASQVAKEAMAAGPALGHVAAVLAAARTALALGAAPEAARLADEAAAIARDRRDRAGLAEALLVRAKIRGVDDPTIDEARAIYEDIGNPVGAASADCILANIRNDAALAADVAARFRELGARGLAAEADQIVSRVEATGSEVEIRTLGGFAVMRNGDSVPPSAWQSKKARDVLKMLVAKRGRPIHREQLAAMMWPDEDPTKTANRLSVALSTIRTVLDPDKEAAPDHYLAADRTSIALRLDSINVDLERFLQLANRGLEAWRARDADGARASLVAAEAAYFGDFLEEDAYADWAGGIRDEARSLYISVANALAADAADQDDPDSAARYFLRVLERDPYDEGAHLGLVDSMAAAGRHGEARRLYLQYCARMEEIDVEAAPYPS